MSLALLNRGYLQVTLSARIRERWKHHGCYLSFPLVVSKRFFTEVFRRSNKQPMVPTASLFGSYALLLIA